MLKMKAMKKGLNMRQAMKRASSMVEKRSKQFVGAVLAEGGALSRTKAPIAYGTLVNSQFSNIVQEGPMITGQSGYNVKYAASLELADAGSWAPRPPPKYGKGGTPANAWNPEAGPGFLAYGFESDAAKAYIDKLMTIFKV